MWPVTSQAQLVQSRGKNIRETREIHWRQMGFIRKVTAAQRRLHSSGWSYDGSAVQPGIEMILLTTVALIVSGSSLLETNILSVVMVLDGAGVCCLCASTGLR